MKNEVSLRLLSVPQLAGDEPFVRLLLPKTGNLLPTHVGLEGSAPSTRMMQSLPLYKDTTAPNRRTHLQLTPSKYADTKKPTRPSRPFPKNMRSRAGTLFSFRWFGGGKLPGGNFFYSATC